MAENLNTALIGDFGLQSILKIGFLCIMEKCFLVKTQALMKNVSVYKRHVQITLSRVEIQFQTNTN